MTAIFYSGISLYHNANQTRYSYVHKQKEQDRLIKLQEGLVKTEQEGGEVHGGGGCIGSVAMP